jgi:hypothetical protein
MAQTAEQIQTELDAVRASLTKAYAAQSYSVSGRSVSRARIESLTARERVLMRRLARVNGNGPLVLSDFTNDEYDATTGRF